MFKMKKIAAVAAVAVMSMSLFTIGANAQKTGSGETSYTNTLFTDRISHVHEDLSVSGTTGGLNVYYMYGASKKGYADMISNYVFNNEAGYKYATIEYNGLSAAENDVGRNDVTVKATTGTFKTSKSSDVYYGGYFKRDKSDSDKRHTMQYILTLK